MRIVHAVRSDNFAGVERHIAVLAGAQAEAGHEVYVVGGDPARMRANLPKGPIDVLPARTTAAVARRLIGVGPADVLHLHMTAAELAGLVASPLVRSPIVVTRHFAARRGSTAWVKPASAVIKRSVHRQIAVSEFVAARIEGTSTVVYAGVPSRRLPDATTRRSEILVAQRLDREKQTHLALEAFARSGLAQSGWRMVVAGRGAELDKLKRTAHLLGVGGAVTFPGFLNDVGVRMGRAGMLLATAPDEPFGLSVVEAMASALPVVAARGGGHLETVGRADDPALFDPGDVDQAATLVRVLAVDEDRRRRYGRDLRQIQRGWFTPAKQYRETMAVYQEALA